MNALKTGHSLQTRVGIATGLVVVGDLVGTGSDEWLAKIKAALDTRHDGDFTILARTDAIAVHGFDDAVDRAQRAVEIGADYAFLEAPEHVEQMRQISRLVKAPTLANMIPGGHTPILPAKELQAMGFAAVAWPNAFTYAYAKTATELAAELLRTGTTAGFDDRMIEFEKFNDLVGLPVIRDAEKRYYAEVDHLQKGAARAA